MISNMTGFELFLLISLAVTIGPALIWLAAATIASVAAVFAYPILKAIDFVGSVVSWATFNLMNLFSNNKVYNKQDSFTGKSQNLCILDSDLYTEERPFFEGCLYDNKK